MQWENFSHSKVCGNRRGDKFGKNMQFTAGIMLVPRDIISRFFFVCTGV
jgi:hypothetical protein